MARLDEHLQRLLCLNTVRERVEALLQEASEKELSYAAFLDGLLSEEVSAKTAKHVTDADEPGPVPVHQGARQLRTSATSPRSTGSRSRS